LRRGAFAGSVMAMITDISLTPVVDLVEQWVALWHEPSSDTRRALIERVWATDGTHVLTPPEAVRDEATRVGFPNATLTARGHDELYARVTRAYDEFDAPGTMRFTLRERPRLLGDLLTFAWHAVEPGDGSPLGGGGTEVCILTPEGRIATDYQLIDFP
jgi:hypothetical protein